MAKPVLSGSRRELYDDTLSALGTFYIDNARDVMQFVK